MSTYYPTYDLTNKKPKDTFTQLVQNNGGILIDGSGNSIDNINISASSASSSYSLTSSYALSGGSGGTITGTNYNVPVIISNALNSSSIYSNANQVTIGSSSFSSAAVLTVYGDSISPTTVVVFQHNVDNYEQAKHKNVSSGKTASVDIVGEADTGNDTMGYIDLGINCSAYSQSAYNIGGPLDGYLLTVDSASIGGNLTIGTLAANKAIKFFTSGSQTINERLRITDTSISCSVPISGTFVGIPFTKASIFSNPTAITQPTNTLSVWYAPYACSINTIRAYISGSGKTNVSVNNNGLVNHLTSSLPLSSSGVWTNVTTISASNYNIGDVLNVSYDTLSGLLYNITVQVDFVK